MPKGDIDLPNASGKTDPRLSPHARAQAANQRAFHHGESDRQARAAAPKRTQSPARRIIAGIRTLTR